MELNPNHPALKEVREDWHKVVAILVHMMGGEVTIQDAAIRELPDKFALAVYRGDDYVRLKIMTPEEAVLLAHREGGLPN